VKFMEGSGLRKTIRVLFDRSSDLNPRNMRLGMYAWLIQRLSGLFLVVFVLTHIAAIAQANLVIIKGFQAEVFDSLRNPFWADGSPALIFDLLTLAIIGFHGMNGIRIVFLDLGLGVQRHKVAFWLSMLAAVAVSASVIVLGLPLLP
jgi:succinate dehydrogenase / fumarate reductase cytochrome b subunit